jgi:oligopeptide/dipeptide ABC transporter ATP-binding protein
MTLLDGDASSSTAETAASLLAVEGLEICFKYEGHWTPAVKSATFSVARHEVLGLVGESGSGKTVTAMAAMGLVNSVGGRVTAGRVVFDGQDVTRLGKREWSDLRGQRIGMIFQQPMRSLNPAFTVGEQIAETVRRHNEISRRDAWRRAVETLDRVRIARADERSKYYPHQMSGGMAQRVMIAMALVNHPDLLIADEPTTALDVTVQKKVLDLIREIQEDTHIAVVFITHDLGVVAQMCDNIAVMYAGEVVERGPIAEVFAAPAHPYSEGLLGAIPKPGSAARLASIPGYVPPPTKMPDGCRFNPRCPNRMEGVCTSGETELVEVETGRWTRCRRIHELDLHGVVR